MSQSNLQLVRSLYDAFERGDIPAILQQMDQRLEWNEAENSIYADRNPYIGPQAVLEGVFMRLESDWEEFTVTPFEWLDAGEQIVVLGTYTATYRATGKQVHAQFAHIWSVREEKVVRFQQYTDTKQFAEAVKA